MKCFTFPWIYGIADCSHTYANILSGKYSVESYKNSMCFFVSVSL